MQLFNFGFKFVNSTFISQSQLHETSFHFPIKKYIYKNNKKCIWIDFILHSKSIEIFPFPNWGKYEVCSYIQKILRKNLWNSPTYFFGKSLKSRTFFYWTLIEFYAFMITNMLWNFIWSFNFYFTSNPHKSFK